MVGRNRKQSRPAGGANGPTQFSSNVRLNHKFRFTAASAFNHALSPFDIGGALGSVGTVTNSTVTCFVESFKIRKIEVWSSPASQGANSTVSLDWVGFGNSPNIEFSDTTLSVTKNAHIVTSPPQNSLCHFWQNVSDVTSLFTLVCPMNSIVDLSLDMILADQEVGLVAITGLTTVVLGHIYYLALDRGNAGTNVLVPVSLNTTT